ncbi:MAG: glycosyl hydrolase family 18 protein, partial [Clostridia bacterium]|nr:glycosyl hydrolase family 18 protein [Clostridia bacterium]
PTPVPTPTPTPVPTPTPTPVPTPTPIVKQVLGFTTYYYAGDKSSYNSMVNNTTALNEIATATHVTDGLGNVTGLIPTEQITYANKNNIKPMIMLGNDFKGDVAKTLLESPVNRQNLINNLLNIIKTNNYRGVNIDLEGVYSSNRDHYTALMSEIYTIFNPLGYTVSVSVPAKTVDTPSHSWTWAYDYAAMAKYSDYIMIMAYDEHYPGGTPGAVASIGWVTKVLNYSMTVIPQEKIYLGVAAYGYDWSVNGTKAYSINACYNVASNNGKTVLWDDTAKSPYFSYTDAGGIDHTVWFENAESLGYKLDLVNSTGIAGIGIWRLGLENTDYWTVIKTKLNK